MLFFTEIIKDLIWSWPLLALIAFTGIFLTFWLRGIQFTYLGFALRQVFSPARSDNAGDISQFEALMTSLAGAIGTGTIVGVATALTVGGLGSLFWMWVTALIGMATKYSESLLAVRYRHIDKRGEMIGGPMYYMQTGLKWKKIALLFALLGLFAALTTGNLVQINAIAEVLDDIAAIPPLVKGIILAALTSAVILGGVKAIGRVAGILVPFMALLYIGGGLLILILNTSKLPHALALIFEGAFSGPAIAGGAAGGGIMLTIQLGVARSIFSNEAGLGISSMAAAAAQTDSPGRQAMITMTGALLSTIIVCTITGLVLAVTIPLDSCVGLSTNPCLMALNAFDDSLYGGRWIVIIGLILFAFSTVIAWAYYGEKCAEYLFGEKAVYPYRILFSATVIPGAMLHIDTVWQLADIANGLMAIPNLCALVALAPVLRRETDTFLAVVAKERPIP